MKSVFRRISWPKKLCKLHNQKRGKLGASFVMFFGKASSVATASANGRRSLKKEEEMIIRRRNAEFDRQQLWTGVNDYFRTWNVSVNKYSNWASPEFYNYSSDARMKMINAEKRQEDLEDRRHRLLQLLADEEAGYINELRELKKQKSHVTDDLCFMNLELKRRACEATRREAELKLYHRNTFPPPDQFRKQYNYFAMKAAKEGKCASQPTRNEKFAVQLNSRLSEDADKVEREEKILNTDIMKMQKDLETLMENFKLKYESRLKLKSEEEETPEKISRITKFMDDVETNTPDFSLSLSGANYEKHWKSKCKEVQEDLQKELHFIEDFISCVGDFNPDHAFIYKLQKQKKTLQKLFQTEIGRAKFFHLLECTYKEPTKWWSEELKRWKEDREERVKALADLYSELQLSVRKWTENNLKKQKCLLGAETDLLNQMDKIKKDIKAKEIVVQSLRLNL